MVTADEVKAEVLSNFFVSVFTNSLPASDKWMYLKKGTEGAKSLPL